MSRRIVWGAVAVVMAALAAAWAAPGDAWTDPAQAGPDFAVQGEYRGRVDGGGRWGAQVIALGKGGFRAMLLKGGLPGDGWDGKTRLALEGRRVGDLAVFSSPGGWRAEIRRGELRGVTDSDDSFRLRRVERKSPTLGMAPPPGAVVLFSGANADAWENGKVAEGLLQVGTRTRQAFRDFTFHLEFRTPYMPEARGQARGNSGLYVQDRYEIQILDSFGLEGLDNECGGIYRQSRPRENMCFPPLSWQTYDLEFQAARFSGTQKTEDAVLTVRHNGVVIHDRLRLSAITPGGSKNREDATPGPFQVQNHGNPVHVRNVWVRERP
ncbi:MAG: DUF1080 domain-containing protein [Armatimonadetes bacterium]|nr:DUF1080 domain-containing protein [Armatimonadota bacterium]